MSRQLRDNAFKSLLAELKKAKYLHLKHAVDIMKKAGYDGGAQSILSAMVKAKKVKRFKDDKGEIFFYTGKCPAGMNDLGYKMLRVRQEDGSKGGGAGEMLLTIPWGRNRSETVTMTEARRIYQQLKAIFEK